MQRGEGFIERSLRLLTAWMGSAEAFWYPLPGREGLGCYGADRDTSPAIDDLSDAIGRLLKMDTEPRRDR